MKMLVTLPLALTLTLVAQAQNDASSSSTSTPETPIQLPQYNIQAPRVSPHEQKILKLETDAHRAQEETRPTAVDRALNPDALAFFSGSTASKRAADAQRRLDLIELEQTTLVSAPGRSQSEQREMKELIDSTKVQATQARQ